MLMYICTNTNTYTVTVINTNTNTTLGGDDFDALIVDWMVEQYALTHSKEESQSLLSNPMVKPFACLLACLLAINPILSSSYLLIVLSPSQYYSVLSHLCDDDLIDVSVSVSVSVSFRLLQMTI